MKMPAIASTFRSYARSVSTRIVSVERRPGGAAEDTVAIEEPLDIRVDDDTLAITMRTPGHDRELVLGFLVSEGIIRTRDDVSALANCGRPGDPGYANTIAVTLGPGAQVPASERVRRGTLTSSACGVCGRKTIDDLLDRIPKRGRDSSLPAKVIVDSVAALRQRQPLFDRTGGVHAASLLDFEGHALATFEDVGRHNAVDKVIGSQLLAGTLGASQRLLVVSGRSSFEIVQKALSAGIDAVASVSAPSSLAVDLANEGGLILAGFVRGERLVIYSAPSRVT
jgi:FdhD protein